MEMNSRILMGGNKYFPPNLIRHRHRRTELKGILGGDQQNDGSHSYHRSPENHLDLTAVLGVGGTQKVPQQRNYAQQDAAIPGEAASANYGLSDGSKKFRIHPVP